ncbi:MAG: 7,8-didemethyl-8-hydroxy-5-deazariboflavin synthase subunit CofG [Verrucomicrobia bacterium]|nr:7,8-didemethyl-8-hydroxy-5-deazariboflavin synthase subunit CofG [Verrucomicrobiota bacterium]
MHLLKAVYEESLQAGRPVTYSRSLTFVLTHDCPWHCRYCGFRQDREGLMSDRQLESLLQAAREGGGREALLISGERPDTLPHIRQELARRGFSDFWDFAVHVADRCAGAGLFPHGNFGRMTEEELIRTRPYFVSMGMMLESVQDDLILAPEKRAAGRIAGIQAAGRAQIPFTSGILVGWGESQGSRLKSLEKLAELHSAHGHLQEILIQRYVPNEGSSWPAGTPPTVEEYREMFRSWRCWAPGVAIQIPPNLEPRWPHLLPWLDDLGGISWAKDEVNPTRPWETVESYAETCRKAGRELVERLPIYESHIQQRWLEPKWLEQVEAFRTGVAA